MKKYLEMLEKRMLEGDGGAGNGGNAANSAPNAGTPAQGNMQQQAQQQTQPQKRPFKELIKGEYKEEFGQEVKGIIADRMKGHNAIKQNWEAVAPIVSALSQKYGVENDMTALAQAFEADQQMSETLYAEAANREGIPVSTYKQMQQMKRDQQELAQIKTQQRRQMEAQQFFQGLEAQAAEMQKIVPGFNLGQELQNEKFKQLVNPVNGWSVQDAYFAAHAQEIQQAGMQYATQMGAQRIAQSVQAGAARPMESAAMQGGGGQIGLDIRNISRQDREKINERVRRGEKIYL